LAPPLAAPAGVAVAERAWLPPSVAPQARPPAGTAAVSLAAVMPDPASTPGMPDPASAPGMPPTAWASATGPNGVSGLPTGTVVPCGSCGSPNAVGMKFCGNCGKRLDASVAPAPVVDAGPARTMFMHVAGGVAAPREKLCKLVTIDQSGREGMTFTLKSGETICGREQGVILLVDDPYVSPTHCKFAFHDGVLKVTDLSSLNGVYLRVRQERSLVSGDVVRVGRQLFRYETLAMAAFQLKKADGDSSRIWGSPVGGAFGRLVQILEDGRTGEVRLLSGERCQIGRETGDIVLPTDGFVSGRHCVFTNQSGTVVLADLGSSNGTYVRIRGEAEVAHGDFLLVGNQMLRVEIV
jgi:pSer/pThr/pTyr-binding forkhead associated (FHA) protein